MESNYLTLSNGLRLHYLWGAGEGPAILMLHGLASNAKMYVDVGERLQKAGMKVVSLDQRGHGQSDKPETGYDYDTFVSNIQEFLSVMVANGTLTKPILLVGQSFGCSVVENYSLRYPYEVKGIVLIDGGYRSLKRDFPTWKECAATLSPPVPKRQNFESLSKMLDGYLAEFPISAIDGALANFTEDENGFMKANLPRHLHMKILHELWKQSPEDIFPSLSVPFVFVTAINRDIHEPEVKKDAVAELRRSSNVASSEYWITGHHDLHAQHPVEVTDIILNELAQGVFAQ